MTIDTQAIDIFKILDVLPHRYPFLLVDKVLHYEKSKALRAVKNVTFNEPCFQGHFPGRPIFPGVLILEAMAQATGILAFMSLGELKPNEVYYFAGIDKARFKYPVHPGDQMMIEVELLKSRRKVTWFDCVATVNEKVVCEASIMCARHNEVE